MTKLLYIESSPRKQRSKSIRLAQAFLDEYRAAHPDDEIVTLDLWSRTLPEFDGDTIDAKYSVMHGQDPTDDQRRAWQAIVDICDEFKSADKYVFSVPMWNFSIPYRLKHYIDLLAQPGQTFSFSPETGYTGLVTGKPVAVLYARGGDYRSDEMQPFNHQQSYMELMLGFLGFTDIHTVAMQPVLAAPEDVARTEAEATAHARQLANGF
ncbi:MAG: FMN-dependent NADH-azoreductase [Maioricimonas sp. JB045]|uniref:FMN-dependent NADH-azoreductase n=1 Tax=Maioricimonas sp. JC845 TaxID=3232138 RepID=UPI00345A9F30